MNNPESKEIPDEIAISNAVPDDAAVIANIENVTWLATYPNEQSGVSEDDIKAKNLESPERVQKWKEKIEDQSGDNLILVARDHDKLVGFCFVKKEENYNFIDSLYIRPEYQGRGLGRQLMDQGMSWLGTEKDIMLDVAEYNSHAIEFYKQLGFEILGPEDPSLATKLPSGNIIP